MFRLHYEGSLEEIDTILSLVRDGICQCDEHILESILKNDQNRVKWWQGHKVYLSDILHGIMVDKK